MIGVAAVVAAPLLVALFTQNEYTVSRTVTIDKPRPEVFSYLKQLKNQDRYNKWIMTDPDMKKTFIGTDGTEGFVYAWDGNDQAGAGEQEIQKLTDGERIDVEIRFKRPFESVAHTPFTTEAVTDAQTKVTWEMQGRSPYPLNLMNYFIDGLLGKDMETSLGTLKSILEKQPISQINP